VILVIPNLATLPMVNAKPRPTIVKTEILAPSILAMERTALQCVRLLINALEIYVTFPPVM
jgi:hypothetical protein